jgi:hypothetical protein
MLGMRVISSFTLSAYARPAPLLCHPASHAGDWGPQALTEVSGSNLPAGTPTILTEEFVIVLSTSAQEPELCL